MHCSSSYFRKVIPNGCEADLRVIINDILPHLPSFISNKDNVRHETLHMLLTRVNTHLECHDYDSALSVLSLASTFCKFFYTQESSATRFKRKALISGDLVTTDLAARFLMFFENGSLFSNMSPEFRCPLVDLACDVCEVTGNSWESSERISAFVNIAPRLLKVSSARPVEYFLTHITQVSVV